MKIVLPQNIPSSFLQQYKEFLTLAMPDGTVRKRYPFEMPDYKSEGKFVSEKQLAQRVRFLEAVALFNQLTTSQREDWFASPPNTDDFSWYMNYFIMSSLSGNIDLLVGGLGVVKSIHYYTTTIGAGSSVETVYISEVDASKTITFCHGSSILPFTRSSQDFIFIDFPTVWVLYDNVMLVKWLMGSLSGGSTESAVVSIVVLEYI